MEQLKEAGVWLYRHRAMGVSDQVQFQWGLSACGRLGHGLHDFAAFVGTDSPQKKNAQMLLACKPSALGYGQRLPVWNVQMGSHTQGGLGKVAL